MISTGCGYVVRDSLKGQLISKCPFGVLKFSKKPTIFFPGFLPYPLKKRSHWADIDIGENQN
jgi:hypothetical protein